MRHTPCLLSLALASAMAGLPAQAFAISRCYYDNNAFPLELVRDLGTLYVPRDAPEGAIIGHTRRRAPDGPIVKNTITCIYEPGSFATSAQITASRPLAPPPANPDPEYAADRLIETSVPGVAVQMEFASFFTAGNSWLPSDGRPPIAPFYAEKSQPNGSFYDVFSGTNAWVTLVKTGPIPVGPNVLPQEQIFTGTFTTVGVGLTYSVKAIVIQAQCDAGASGPIEVDLGTWDRTHFTAPGTTTPSKPVTISLTNCQNDPVAGNATVHAEFTPTDGSMPVGDPATGVFSMSNGASAKGVGIQLLQQNGSPMPLNQPLPIEDIPGSGNLNLNFSAHLYQTLDSSQVQAGSVEGMLTFTLTYQ